MVFPEREPLTEAEARQIGASSQAIGRLRYMLENAKAGSLTVTLSSGSQSLSLYKSDLDACLALLMEREAAFLTSFNVKLDKPL